MKRNQLLIFLCFLMLAYSCLDHNEVEHSSAAGTQDNSADFLINLQGDTIAAGVPILISDNEIDPASTAPPVQVPLKRPPVHEVIKSNVFTTGRLPKVKIPDDLRVVIPGEDGVPLPKSVRALKQIVPIRQPPSQRAMPLSFSDLATYDIQYLDREHGLSSSFVWDILQDRSGHLWFGTGTNGIIRYNGHDFTNYTTREGLSHNTLRAMMEDSRGNLWFATDGGGVSICNGAEFRHLTTAGGLSDNVVYSLLEDDDGNFWIGTRNGLNRFDGDSITYFTTEEGLSGNIVTVIHEDRQGYLWLGTVGRGLTRFKTKANDGRGQFTHFTTRDGLAGDLVRDIWEDPDSTLWFATSGGVSHYDGTHFINITTDEGLNHNTVTAIIRDQHGSLWFGTRNGLNRYESRPDGDGITHFTVDQGLSNDWITAIAEDHQGNLWVGTRGGGVNRYDSRSFSYLKLSADQNNRWVTAIHEDRQGNLWLGTQGGLTKYDGASFKRFTTKHGLNQNEVSSIQADSSGNLWIGMFGSGGLDYFDGHSFKHFGTAQGLISPNIWSMMLDSKGHLWLGTWFRGVSQHRTENGKHSFAHFSMQEGLGSNAVLGFMEDRKGNIWFGTRGGGISRYDGKHLINFNTEKGLGVGGVVRMMEDSKGYLWFAGHGLSRYDPEQEWNRFVTFTKEDGLCDNAIASILEDKQQNIWVSSQNGISVLKPVENKESSIDTPLYSIYSFGVEDGLKKINLAQGGAMIDHKNQIWWGSVNGLTMLDLNRFTLPQDTPEIVFRTIEIDENFIDYGRLDDTSYQSDLPFGASLAAATDSIVRYQNYPESLVLPGQIKHLTFHFYAIDFSAPQKVRYSFMMEGLDYSWSAPRTEGKADYRNVPHGNYNFKVKAIGESKVWSEPFTYTFTILPFWWQTWWAYTLYVLLFLGGLWAVHRYEIGRRQLRYQLELEHVRAEKLEEINQVKTRFFTNISHEFRTPLTLLLGPVRELIGRGRSLDLPFLQLIERNSYRLLNLINQLLDLSKLEAQQLKLQASHQDLVPFLRQLFAAFCSIGEQKGIQYTFHADRDSVLLYFDQEKLEKVLLNLQTNAFKFTPEGGCVKMDLRTHKESVEITISDTGPGIPPDQLSMIFDRFFRVGQNDGRTREGFGIGLALAKELVQLHHGQIRVESEPGQGTSFRVWLPLGKAHLQPDEIVTKRDPLPLDLTITGSLVQTQPKKIAGEKIANDLPLLLIVEDNADMRLFIRQILQNDFRIVEAVDGQSGLDFALLHIPDLIVSDVMMPVMDGLELCHRLKSDPRTSHIPFIMLTAKADLKTRIEGLSRGADAYLAKPFDQKELMIRLEKLLELRQKLQARYQSTERLEPTGDPAIEIEDDFIKQLENIVRENISDYEFGIGKICQEMHMSRSQIYRKLKVLTGKSVNEYIRTLRLRKAKHLLQTSDFNVSQVAYEVGFKDPAYFSRSFSKEFGVSPSELL